MKNLTDEMKKTVTDEIRNHKKKAFLVLGEMKEELEVKIIGETPVSGGSEGTEGNASSIENTTCKIRATREIWESAAECLQTLYENIEEEALTPEICKGDKEQLGELAWRRKFLFNLDSFCDECQEILSEALRSEEECKKLYEEIGGAFLVLVQEAYVEFRGDIDTLGNRIWERRG